MPQPTFTIGLTMKDTVFLILTKFTTNIINTTIAMPFASNLFHVKVININSPGSNPSHVCVCVSHVRVSCVHA